MPKQNGHVTLPLSDVLDNTFSDSTRPPPPRVSARGRQPLLVPTGSEKLLLLSPSRVPSRYFFLRITPSELRVPLDETPILQASTCALPRVFSFLPKHSTTT